MTKPVPILPLRLHVAWAGRIMRGPDAPGAPATAFRQLPRMLCEWTDRGSWRIIRPGRPDVVAGPKDVLVIMPEIPHRMIGLGPPRWTTCWSLIDVDQGPGLPLLDARQEVSIIPAARSSRLRRTMSRLADTDDGDACCRSRLRRQELGAALVGELVGLRPDLALVRPDPRILRLAEVMAFVESHLGDRLSRDGLARLAGLSPSRFHDVFTAAFGRSPMAQVLHLRLARARGLLQHGGLGGSEVAERCGFSSHAHFCRSFRAAFGMTPVSWQRGSSQAG